MIGRDSQEDLDHYGLAPWGVGLIIAASILITMFTLAAGFA
ncbi:dihydroxy-acid dehydratase [Terasakiispira papahanaumokuakeensis]|uniref:Dihydroxy-acid dehydratase n=1 Tax=Terasakiispira papahanaumokuakeensis TaxID=197479 RepID=A0A1E2V9R3_9GAMM|nr:dihydroxy-acid dehydratase [Terasakiispira papahanaumokuakeensis]ODC03566.1 dihydroxy-acid dehydratase [Terasakiispira papahanaumokuakeensis]